MIPHILHFVWFGGKLPERYQKWESEWATLHPDWAIMKWDEQTYKGPPAPANCCHVRQRSNWVRLHVLYEFGGVYTDYDTQPLKNIVPLIDDKDAIATPFHVYRKSRPTWVCNSFIGATKGNPWIGECIGLLDTVDPAKHLSMGSDLISTALEHHPEVSILDRACVLQWPFWHLLGRQPDPRWYAIHYFDNMTTKR